MARVLVLALVLAFAPVAGAAQVPVFHPQLQVGGFPTGITLNTKTDTIYVGNGTTQSLSLIDGRKCNAGNASGCGQRVTAVTAGDDPIGIAVDEATNTVYAANFSGTVAVVDGKRCDGANTSGCKIAPRTVRVGLGPQFLAVDEATHTVYVANSSSNSVSVIDSKTHRVRATVAVGPAPFAVAVNEVTNSIYVTDLGAPTVSVINGGTCNASITSGCRRKPVSVNVGDTPGGVALNSRTNTIYVTGEASSDVSVINGMTCNAHTTSGCRQKPVRIAAGLGARGIDVNEATDTVYVANTAANTVSVIDGRTCNASVTSGCAKASPVAEVGVSPRRVAVDQVTNTVYVTNAGSNSVTMLNGRTCDSAEHTGC
ncbi:MAG TPA: YncE family protein [Gaiellaceae bacterium]|jgi:YVTN family beta-propeller protein